MSNWTDINLQQDIDHLMLKYGEFHDSCIAAISYNSGAFVDDDNAMHFGTAMERELRVFFHSQLCKETLELCFNGVKKYCIVGWEENYTCDIFDCYLSFHRDLITGRDEDLIVWADVGGFEPKAISNKGLLEEPSTTFIIAEKLKWRFIDK